MTRDVVAPGPLATATEAVVTAVGAWPGVTVREHPYGGLAFHLGAREFGHVHRSGLVDVNYSREVRDALVAGHRTGTHHVHPDSGWTSYRLRGPAGVDGAVWLLRLSYLATLITLSRTHTGREALAELDLQRELDALQAPDHVVERYLERASALGLAD